MVTIQDVAKAARVSPMTVSNVLNNYPHIKKETRDRVLEAIDELDYRVNVAARNLRAGRTMTIGFAVPEIDRSYFGQLGARIIEKAAAHGYRVAIEQTRADREYELSAISSSRNRLYDGLILSAVGLSDRDRDQLRADSPTVLLGETLYSSSLDHIALPNEEGTRAATRYLLDKGCHRIAIVEQRDASDDNVSGRRHRGFLAALAESGIHHDPSRTIGLGGLSADDGVEAAARLVEIVGGFDGVVCITDTVALGVMRGLADHGVRVPEDARVIGFDGIDEGRYWSPRLTTVAPDHDQVAQWALDRLMLQIARDPAWAPQEFVADFALLERESA